MQPCVDYFTPPYEYQIFQNVPLNTTHPIKSAHSYVSIMIDLERGWSQELLDATEHVFSTDTYAKSYDIGVSPTSLNINAALSRMWTIDDHPAHRPSDARPCHSCMLFSVRPDMQLYSIRNEPRYGNCIVIKKAPCDEYNKHCQNGTH